jgi:hypothetical protein
MAVVPSELGAEHGERTALPVSGRDEPAQLVVARPSHLLHADEDVRRRGS